MRPATVMLPPGGVKPIGIIEFVHGMCEHRKRYDHVLKYFSQKGFVCAIADLRGHGENVLTKDDLGYFGNEGYKGLVQDVDEYTMFLKREYRGLPVILIGHSMGSLIVRAYMKKHSKKLDAVVLCGSPSNQKIAGFGRFLTSFMALFAGERYRSDFITNMVNGPFEKPFAKDGLKNAWLSSDISVADAFNKDDNCGFSFTLNGYHTLFSLIQTVYSKEGWKNQKRDLPVMFISGGDDPCRINDKKFKEAVLILKKCGFPNTFSNVYPDKRHELFNETNKKEVFDDILKFLDIKAGIEVNE